MDDLIVLDGDFEAQLRRNLTIMQSDGELDKAFALQALQSNPYAVYNTHLDYLRAGAKIIRTNTYRASKSTLMTYLNASASESLELISLAVTLAKQAAYSYYKDEEGDRYKNKGQCKIQRPLVAGSCGSYTATHFSEESDILMQNKNITPGYVAFFYQQRIDMLLNAGVDLLAFESIPSLAEAKLIIKLLPLYSNVRAWITFHCTIDGKVMDGKEFVEAATYCYLSLPNQIIAIGAECPCPSLMQFEMRKIKSNLVIPFVYFPKKYHMPPDLYNDNHDKLRLYIFVKEWLDIGVRFIGGGTNIVAEDIQIICKLVEIYRSCTNNLFAALKTCSYQNKDNRSKL